MSVIIDPSFNPRGHRDWKALGFSSDAAKNAELSNDFFISCFEKANIAERYGWVPSLGYLYETFKSLLTKSGYLTEIIKKTGSCTQTTVIRCITF